MAQSPHPKWFQVVAGGDPTVGPKLRCVSQTGPVAEENFPPDAESVSRARRFVARTLLLWDAEVFELSAVGIASELATNAVLHARTEFSVRLALVEGKLRIEVRDGSAQRPRTRRYAADATTGRGLALVESLAAGWGAQRDGAGKMIWALVDQVADEPDLAHLFADDVTDLTAVERPASSASNGVQSRAVA